MPHVSILSIALLCFAEPRQSNDGIACGELNPERINQIASMLPPTPMMPGDPITERPAWERLRRIPAYEAMIAKAESLLTTPLANQPDELYLEFSRNGNRTNFQEVAFARRGRLTPLVLAECLENKGRFLPAIEELVNALCAERTWVLPAHDANLTNFKGTLITIDLASSALACELAATDYLIASKFSPAIRATIRENVMRRVIEPFRDMIHRRRKADFWISATHNWNAVCLAGVTGAALFTLDTPQERAEIIAAAESYSKYFLSGFTSDGYCSEGLSYWVYGFGHYAMLSEMVRYATKGAIDLLARPEAAMPARFPPRIEIMNGVSPAFADCSITAKPPEALMWLISRRLHLGLQDYARIHWDTTLYSLSNAVIYASQANEDRLSVAPTSAAVVDFNNLRTWFDKAGVLICRPHRNSQTRMGVALKGGNNAEHHNHNDVGSYVVACGTKLMLLDPGNETYTARTFSNDRYVSRLLNSFGHPVPVVAGNLQRTGPQAQARVLQTNFGSNADILCLDIAPAYDCKQLLQLVRTFTYNRSGAGQLTIDDRVSFSTPQSFATAIVTLGNYEQIDNHTMLITVDNEKVRITIDTGGQPFSLYTETIKENAPVAPMRIGINLDNPVTSATITLSIKAEH